MREFVVAAIAAQFASSALAADTCPLTNKFVQSAKGGAKVVRYDADAVIFQASFRVDTDGNARSYSAVDPVGQRCAMPDYKDKDPFASGCAMDSLCNGLKMYGPTTGGKVTHFGSENCPSLLKLFKRYRDSGYALTDGTRIDPAGSIAVHSEGTLKGRPCETAEGLLVSTTSAQSGLPPGDCKQDQYLDSAVPYMVVPKCWSADYRQHNVKQKKECKKELPAASVIDVAPGDLVAMRKKGSSGKPHFAIVGDLGPNHKLGEASIGFHMIAAGATALPRTVDEANAYDDGTEFDVVVFRHTAVSGQVLTPGTFGAMAAVAKKTFDNWKLNGLNGSALLSACAGTK
jgi:hypothetical protein